jgi:hypothetical protein
MPYAAGPWRGLVRDLEAIGDRLLGAACFDAVPCSVRPSVGGSHAPRVEGCCYSQLTIYYHLRPRPCSTELAPRPRVPHELRFRLC